MKLSSKQKEVVKAMREGYPIKRSAFIKIYWVNGINVPKITFKNLLYKRIIGESSDFEYELTDLGRTINID